MTVVITGGAGTIGTALAAALTADGIPIRLLDIRPLNQVAASAEAQQVDLRDLAATVEASPSSRCASAASVPHPPNPDTERPG